MSSVVLTGHRDLTGPQARWLRNQLIAVLGRLAAANADTAHCGLAYGADTHFGFTALAAGMRLHAHVPHLDQAAVWSASRKDSWRILMRQATDRTIYGSLDGLTGRARTSAANRLPHVRNAGMIAAALADDGHAIVAWDGRRTGGTWSAIRMLHRRGRAVMPITWLDLAGQTVVHGIPDHLLQLQH